MHVACSSNCSPDTQINHVDICVSIGVNSPSSGSNQYFSERGTAACFMVRCLSYSPLCRGVDQQREMIWRAVGKASVHVWCFLVKNGLHWTLFLQWLYVKPNSLCSFCAEQIHWERLSSLRHKGCSSQAVSLVESVWQAAYLLCQHLRYTASLNLRFNHHILVFMILFTL